MEDLAIFNARWAAIKAQEARDSSTDPSFIKVAEAIVHLSQSLQRLSEHQVAQTRMLNKLVAQQRES